MRVAVTEPRRLAAVTVAERVATERGEKVGGGALHNAYIEQLDSSVYKIEPYIILSYIL